MNGMVNVLEFDCKIVRWAVVFCHHFWNENLDSVDVLIGDVECHVSFVHVIIGGLVVPFKVVQCNVQCYTFLVAVVDVYCGPLNIPIRNDINLYILISHNTFLKISAAVLF